jgi:hypothetical protein
MRLWCPSHGGITFTLVAEEILAHKAYPEAQKFAVQLLELTLDSQQPQSDPFQSFHRNI